MSVKGTIIGSVCGLVLGAGAMTGMVYGIPALGNALTKTKTDTTQVDELRVQNNKLQSDNKKLSEQLVLRDTRIKELESEISTKIGTINSLNSTITTKNDEITSKQELITSLNTQIDDLNAKIETYKELSGADSNYIELINQLQSEVATKTSALLEAQSQLSTITAERDDLLIQVQELTTQVSELEEELSLYKSQGEIDKLQVSSYNGIWYKNGSFADYYTIDNGIVTHNANQDKGLLNNIYNQMYLMMNTSGGTPVTLSDDGNSFVTDSGDSYSKFYTNTITKVDSDYLFCGTYTHENESIKINTDNTINLTNSDNTYNGAYIVITKERNYGGNITRINEITATFQINGESVVKNYKITSKENILVNADENISYTQTEFIKGALLTPASSSSNPTMYGTNGIKILVRTTDNVVVNPNYNANLIFNTTSYNYYVNGASSNNGTIVLRNTTSETINTNIFELWFYSSNTTGKITFPFSDIYTINNTSCDILSVEYCGTYTPDKYVLKGKFLDVYNKTHGVFNNIQCSKVSEYINGTYANSDMSIVVGDETNITLGDSDSITATNTITAETDGTDIYHTMTITYSTIENEVSTNHTLVIKMKNNNIQSSTLDETEIELNKN